MPKSESNKQHSCFLSLGSNLNSPIHQLSEAIKHINNSRQTQFIQSASWYQSEAWGVIEQNDFVNTVIEINTSLTPLALLKAIKIIEYRLMQRQINKKWHARKIDIDILLYAQQKIHRKQLIIPHPFIAERPFVWKPLLQLKPFLPASLKQKLQHDFEKNSTESKLRLIQAKNYCNPMRK